MTSNKLIYVVIAVIIISLIVIVCIDTSNKSHNKNDYNDYDNKSKNKNNSEKNSSSSDNKLERFQINESEYDITYNSNKKIDFKTSKHKNRYFNLEVFKYKKYIKDGKIIRSIIYGYYILENTETSLLIKLKIPNGEDIDSDQVEDMKESFIQNINNSYIMNTDDAFNLHILTYIFETKRNKNKTIFKITGLEKEIIKINKKIIEEIRNKCASMFTEKCYKFITKKNIHISENECISALEITVARFTVIMHHFNDLDEYLRGKKSIFNYLIGFFR